MSDLGFGIVDRRSVLAVLFALGLSKVFLGYDIPIDTSNFLTAFIGLLLLTGFIYATRSILRLGLTALSFIVRFPYDVISGFVYRGKNLRGLRGVIIVIITSLRDSFLFGFFFPSFVAKDWKYKEYNMEYSDYYINSKSFAVQLGALGILDRIILVGISLFATIPVLGEVVKTIGFYGITFMVTIYIVTGSFSFILDDAILKGELKQQEAIDAARNPNITFPSTITTRPERDYSV